MANSLDDIIEKQLNPAKTQFKLDVLDDYEESQWPGRIDYIAHRVAHGNYTVGIQSDNPIQITDGRTLDKAAYDHYTRGIAKLTGNRRHQNALPDDFRLGPLLVQFAGILDGMDDIGHNALEPGEVLGRLLTRNLKRSTSTEEAGLAEQLPRDIQTPRALIAELATVPEIADSVGSALPDSRADESLVDQLANVDLTTRLWDHQFKALKRWIQADYDGYVNMATATGKTVLGLAAVAHCIDAGSLHPDDQGRLQDELGNVSRPTRGSEAKNVLIVTTDELLGVQWGRLFQTHCHTPPEYTKVTDGSIRLPWGRIDIRSAGGVKNIDPSEYRLAIFDEVHNYTKSGGWGEGLQEFVDSRCSVLALTGSETPALKRLTEDVETEFSNVFTYTHTEALEDGVIPDFEWTISFADVDRDSNTLSDLERTADLAADVLDYHAGGLSVNEADMAGRFSEADQNTLSSLAGEYETGTQLASAIRNIDEEAGVMSTAGLETLASGLSNRSIHRLNLSTDHSLVVELAEDALRRERPVLILTQSYSEGKEIWKELYDGSSERIVKRIDREDSATRQDKTITEFDEADTDRKVLIGPGKHIGQGNDIQSVEVGINIARPGSGVNASLVQRLGRLLRKAGEKDQVEFYHVSGVQPAKSVLEPDGVSFIHNVTEFFEQAHTPDTGGIHKPPEVHIENDVVGANVRTLEAAGVDRVLEQEQTTELEAAYASAIAEADGQQSPTVATDWYDEAFPEVVTPEEDEKEEDVRELSVDPVIFAIAKMRIEQSDRLDALEDVAYDALDPFFDAVDGADEDVVAEVFDLATEHHLGFSCDPALEVAIETKIADTDGVDTADDFVKLVMLDWLGVDRSDTTFELTEYQRYQSRIEQLIREDAYPCTSPDEILQAALEIHFDV